MPRTLPYRPTTTLVRGVAVADDERWFAEHPEATLRHRRYYHGEFGLTPEARWWWAEAQELREDVRDNSRLADAVVYIVVVVTRTPGGLHRRFGYVALEWANLPTGLGLVPKRGGPDA